MIVRSFQQCCRLVAVLAVLIAATDALAGSTIKTTEVPFRPDIRALGMGGAYLAAGRNANAFLYNPALLTQSHVDIGLPISIGVNQDTQKVFEFLSDNADSLQKFDELAPADQDKIYQDMTAIDGLPINVRIAPMFNLAVRNFGLAAYGVVKAGVAVDKGIYEPRVSADGVLDVVVAMGFAKKASEKLAIGVNAKVINRRQTHFRVGVSKIGDTFDEVLDSLQVSKTGFALDVGSLYSLGERTRVGFVIQDLTGKVGDDKFPVNVKAGIAHTMWRNHLLLAGDVVDLLNKDGVSLFNRVYLGAEFRIPLISIRGGFYQGYPSFGGGLNIKIIKLDYAYYQVERGRFTGQDSQGQHEVQLKFGWGW
ncbi:MAG: conjugal transfer protein TraF [Candidatus Latescibacteria bacterium]|nr:conjugal transfer protein TraF [Candidatus Latescibacterota bacterium]